MCSPIQPLTNAVQGFMRGMSSLAEGRQQAALAAYEGRQAKAAAAVKAARLEQEAMQGLGAMRRALSGTGNLSGLDFISDHATSIEQEIDWTKHGGKMAQAEARARARYARQQGRLGFATHAVGAATDLLRFGSGFSPEDFKSIFPIV